MYVAQQLVLPCAVLKDVQLGYHSSVYLMRPYPAVQTTSPGHRSTLHPLVRLSDLQNPYVRNNCCSETNVLSQFLHTASLGGNSPMQVGVYGSCVQIRAMIWQMFMVFIFSSSKIGIKSSCFPRYLNVSWFLRSPDSILRSKVQMIGNVMNWKYVKQTLTYSEFI
jgi:hypothetical protein